jgi:hypothetical protein
MPELSLLTRSSAETGRKGENGGSIALSKHAPKSPIGREVDKGNPGIQDGSHRLELTNRWERRGVEGEQSGGSLSLIGRSRREKIIVTTFLVTTSFLSSQIWFGPKG